MMAKTAPVRGKIGWNLMSELVINEPSKNGFRDGFINDVTFLYVSIREARDKYKSTDKEFSAKLVVDEDTADSFKENFPKNGVKEIKTSNFEEQFGIQPPFPKAKKQYLITLKVADDKRITVVDQQTGEEHEKTVKLTLNDFKRPKVYMADPSGEYENIDVTEKVNVGNGSTGHVAFWILDSAEYGSFPKLKAIRVNDLVPYEPSSSNHGAFGSVASDEGHKDGHFSSQAREDDPELGAQEAPY